MKTRLTLALIIVVAAQAMLSCQNEAPVPLSSDTVVEAEWEKSSMAKTRTRRISNASVAAAMEITAMVRKRVTSSAKVAQHRAVVDVSSGERGSRLSVQSISWIDKNEVEVSLWQYFNPLGGGEVIYRFVRKDNTWVFKSKTLGAVS